MKTIVCIFIGVLITGCANIVAPNGGDKDLTPPKIINTNKIYSKKHNTIEIRFKFDELIELNNWQNNFYISPPINKKNSKKTKYNELLLIIDDTLKKNTTYHVSLNNCIKDINEGNVLDSLNYTFSTSKYLDTLKLMGEVKNSYSLNYEKGVWVMLFNKDVHDSLIFKKNPDYIAKTNKNGRFYFPNLKRKKYKLVALSGLDFVYDKGEKIGFSEKLIIPKENNFISLFTFNPVIIKDSFNLLDSLATDTNTLVENDIKLGALKVITTDDFPCVFQLMQNQKIKYEFFFFNKPYVLKNIMPGDYKLKAIKDTDENKEWTTGSWENKQQAEKVYNYDNKIIIRSNWDLELEWSIEE